MGMFVLRRLGVMLLTAIALTFVVFYLTNLPPNLEKLARTEGSVRMSEEAVQDWIEQNGHSGSVFARYGQWVGVVPGWTYTCLLYTSPSPRDRTRSRMPSSA